MRLVSSLLAASTLAAVMMLSGCDNNGGQGTGSSSGSSPSAGGSGGGQSGQPFTIGLAAPLTGNSSEFGVQIKMGVELFADELNAAGGINGRPIKLNEQDDGGKADQAQTVASTLASDDSVLAVIGHFNSSCSLNGKPIYSQAKMVMFSPGSTNVEVTKNSEYVYRNIFTDDFQGQSLANYAGNVLGLKNVAILFDNDDYGAGLKESFKKKAQELGVKVVAEQAYNREQPDFRSQLTTIQGSQPAPEAILVAGLYNEAANIARQARDIGIKAQFMGGDGVFSQQYITLAGAAAAGAYVTCPFLFDLGGEKATKFAEAFHKKYNKDPDAWAALSYDAISLVCDGIKKNGFTRDAVLQHLKSLDSPDKAYDGLTGKTFFDQEGDCKKPVQVAQVKGGKFVAAEKQLGPDGKAVAAATGSAAAATPAATPAATTAAATTPAAATPAAATPAPSTPAPATPAASTPAAPVAAVTSDTVVTSATM
jgi:branched-chain amino acid transport system substrate-binding protein